MSITRKLFTVLFGANLVLVITHWIIMQNLENTTLIPIFSSVVSQFVLLAIIVSLGIISRKETKRRMLPIYSIGIIILSINVFTSLFYGPLLPYTASNILPAYQCGENYYVTTMGKEAHHYHRLNTWTMTKIDTYFITYNESAPSGVITYLYTTRDNKNPELFKCLRSDEDYILKEVIIP